MQMVAVTATDPNVMWVPLCAEVESPSDNGYSPIGISPWNAGGGLPPGGTGTGSTGTGSNSNSVTTGNNSTSTTTQTITQPHHYSITTSTTCSAPDAFNSLEAPDTSAPGAPAAQEGTQQLNLTGDNRILQTVNTPAMTIVNTTLPGHVFYPGSVTIQVSPQGNGSVIQVTGTGTGSHPYINDVVGYLFFGLMSYLTQTGCDLATGTPGAGNGNY